MHVNCARLIADCFFCLFFCRKYERTKEIISGFKKNEDDLKGLVSELANKCKKSEERFENLKSHAEDKLNE